MKEIPDRALFSPNWLGRASLLIRYVKIALAWVIAQDCGLQAGVFVKKDNSSHYLPPAWRSCKTPNNLTAHTLAKQHNLKNTV